ncbi:hypothetical protein [Tessaracoccus sp. OH4464_COT-324]|nr:hypothetical protein [Tessaracoccus sp. OH4464_COT-324]
MDSLPVVAPRAYRLELRWALLSDDLVGFINHRHRIIWLDRRLL